MPGVLGAIGFPASAPAAAAAICSGLPLPAAVRHAASIGTWIPGHLWILKRGTSCVFSLLSSGRGRERGLNRYLRQLPLIDMSTRALFMKPLRRKWMLTRQPDESTIANIGYKDSNKDILVNA